MLKMIRSWFGLRSARRAAWQGRRAVEGLDGEALIRMARDLGVGVRELDTVMGHSVRSERPLGGTLGVLRLMEQAARLPSSASCDVASACARYGSALTCGREILNGSVPENLDLYCANSSELLRLRTSQGFERQVL